MGAVFLPSTSAMLAGLVAVMASTACLGGGQVDSPIPPGPRVDAAGDTGDTGAVSVGGADGGGDGDTDAGADGGGSSTGASTDGGTQPTEPDPSEACHPAITDWPADWADFEAQVVVLTNDARAVGADCGTEGRFPAVGPVELDPYIVCAARYHSVWMAQTGIFDHYSYGGDLGDDPWERMANAGFTGSGVGENIAAGYFSPEEVVAGWLDSDGHCANLMSSSATLMGVGYFEGGSYGSYWTQDFGR